MEFAFHLKNFNIENHTTLKIKLNFRDSNDQDRLKERQKPPKELRWALG